MLSWAGGSTPGTVGGRKGRLNFLYSTDGNKGIGSNASNLYKCTFAALWQGANGEDTDAEIKALLGASSWTPPWSL